MTQPTDEGDEPCEPWDHPGDRAEVDNGNHLEPDPRSYEELYAIELHRVITDDPEWDDDEPTGVNDPRYDRDTVSSD